MIAAGGRGSALTFGSFLRRAETLGILALTLALAIGYGAAREAWPFQAIEGQTLDWRFRIRGPRIPGPEVAIVAIDDRTLAELGRWPFSRVWLARAVDALVADGARVIAFDLLLVGSEAGPAAPAGDTADRALAASLARAGNVVVPFAFVFDPAEANVFELPAAVEAAAFRVVRSDGRPRPEPAAHPAGALVPLPSFLEAGMPAHATIFLEADGSFRLANVAIRYGDAYYPSLPVETARLFLGADRDRVTLSLGRGVSIDDHFLPTDPKMRLAVDHAGSAGTFRTLSLVDVLRGAFKAGAFRDRIVLIGATASGLGDRFVTPFSSSLPGVEVFATMTENISRGGFLRRSPLTAGLDLLAVVLGGLLAASVGMLRGPLAMLLAMAVLLGGWSAINLYAFVALRSWLNFTFPALAIVAGSGMVVVGRIVRENRLRTDAERRSERLARYVSPLATISLGMQHADGGSAERSRMAAVMFTDLVGFTRASEKMTPGETAQLLRRFHACVERAARGHRGVIDKYIGDAALVVFGVPSAEPSSSADAVVCARAIAAEVAGWNAELQRAGQPGVGCGIGIHFGPVSVAEVGGSVHAQITVTGDTVNVASRLEALTRTVGTTVIVSDAVVEAARAAGAEGALADFAALPVQSIRGRDRPLGIWAWPAPSGR